MKVVTYNRVSGQLQDYQRQITELNTFSQANGWEVSANFSEKVSGTKKNSERPILLEMMEYVRDSNNDIGMVLVWELSRLGRNTLEALKTIQELTELGICVHVKLHNIRTLKEDGTPDPIAKLILTFLLEFSELEKNQILARVNSGYKAYILAGNKPGRKIGSCVPEEQFLEKYASVVKYLRSGKKYSLRAIAKLTDSSLGTVQRVKAVLNKPVEEAA